MYDETGQPSETLVMDWNEHNDHADDLGEQEPDDSGIEELYAFAATFRDAAEASRRRESERVRAERIEAVELLAAQVWDHRFRALPGQRPPVLRWKGYARDIEAMEGGPDAVAYLGRGIFLAATLTEQREDFEVIATCPGAETPCAHTVWIDHLEDLADALDPLLAPGAYCNSGCKPESAKAP